MTIVNDKLMIIKYIHDKLLALRHASPLNSMGPHGGLVLLGPVLDKPSGCTRLGPGW